LSIYRLLDQIQSLVESAPKLPLSAFKLVRTEELQHLIERAVAELPSELAEAKQLVAHEQEIISLARRQAQEIIARAQEESAHIIGSAENQAYRMIDESEIIKHINNESEKIREDARKEVQRVYEITEREVTKLEQDASTRIKITLDEAIAEAEAIRSGANSYAEAVLLELEKTTSGAVSMIQNGQRYLAEFSSSNSNLKLHQIGKFKSALSGVKNLPNNLFSDERENHQEKVLMNKEFISQESFD
jgi:hypothetical protein